MNWFLIALIPPLLDSITVHIDKHLLSKYFKGGGIGALLIFSSLIGLFVFPFILLFHPLVFRIEIKYALLLALNGFMGALLLIPYFYALNKDEASVVVPLFQLIPVFSYILAFFVLGEVLNSLQILAGILIMVGAIILSLDLSNRKAKFKKAVFWLMFLASFLYALNSLVFKFIALKGDFLTTIFWEYVGLGFLGVLLYIFVIPYRKQFQSILKTNTVSVLSLNALNEIIYVIATFTLKFAFLLAPLALVWVVSGFQPLFVFFLGIILTLFFPKFGKENLSKGSIFQKLVALYVMFVGLYILNN